MLCFQSNAGNEVGPVTTAVQVKVASVCPDWNKIKGCFCQCTRVYDKLNRPAKWPIIIHVTWNVVRTPIEPQESLPKQTDHISCPLANQLLISAQSFHLVRGGQRQSGLGKPKKKPFVMSLAVRGEQFSLSCPYKSVNAAAASLQLPLSASSRRPHRWKPRPCY